MSENSASQTTLSRDVFVSYASQDASVANAIVRALEDAGFPCWVAPRDVTPGTLYADRIIRAINEAKVLVLVLSASSIASKHVGKEVERASSKGRPIIALKVDAAPLTTALEYFLSESQWIDVPAMGMAAALTKLAETVGRGSAKESAEPGSAPKTARGMPARRSLGVSRRVAIGAGVAIVAIGVAVGFHFWPAKRGVAEAPAVTAISDKSIAVLPFTDMSQKKDQEYFGDGMAEEILDRLAKIPGLTVIGRTSSFQFKGKNEDLRKIGTELNAAYVLEGSVRNSGDQVRITAQLINAKTGAHEWSETYDRPIGDVLKMQDAIAAAVVRELQLTVDPEHLQSRSTLKSVEAYDLILRGRHASDRWDKEGEEEAVALFQRALDQDATSADAAAELAFAYYKQGANDFMAPAVTFEKARRAASMALKLDPTSARAHYILGKIHTVYDWDWTAAEKEFQEVETIAPGNADGPSGEAYLSFALGHWDDGLRQIKAAIALDPMDANNFQNLALIQLVRKHLPEAEAAMRRGLDIRPTFAFGQFTLGLVLVARGDFDAALRVMQEETAEDARLDGFAVVYHALGKKTESDAALSRLIKGYAGSSAFEIAEVYSHRGQVDETLHWLEQAYLQRDANIIFVKFLLDKGLAADPRSKAFLKKMNLPE
jgi:TolB-like protein